MQPKPTNHQGQKTAWLPKNRLKTTILENERINELVLSFEIEENLNKLNMVLPDSIKTILNESSEIKTNITDLIIDLDKPLGIKCYNDKIKWIENYKITLKDINYIFCAISSVKENELNKLILTDSTIVPDDHRMGINGTLHRISVILNRNNKLVGLTCRVGRSIKGLFPFISDIVSSESILLLGKPCIGKTTILRDIARSLSSDIGKYIIVVDTSCEIGGYGDVAHSAIGNARRFQVKDRDNQEKVMLEAVINHSPEVLIIDEIANEQEVSSICSIAQRGIQLIATVHGKNLKDLINNKDLNGLVGGVHSVILGDDERHHRKRNRKTIQERQTSSPFTICVEIIERNKWIIHKNINANVDNLLSGADFDIELRIFDKKTGKCQSKVSNYKTFTKF
jgi:stage III sporulation protein AA